MPPTLHHAASMMLFLDKLNKILQAYRSYAAFAVSLIRGGMLVENIINCRIFLNCIAEVWCILRI
jgi:hypothetical protein